MKPWATLGLLSLSAALLAFACSSDDDNPSTTSGTGGTTTTGTGGTSAGTPSGTPSGTSVGTPSGISNPPFASSGLMIVGSGDFGGNATGVISTYRLDYTSGQATPLDSLVVGTLNSFMAVDEPRSLLHVGDEAEGSITTYELGSDGSLTERASASSVGNPVHLALDPDRTHLFVSHYGPGRTEVFGLDANGWVTTSLDDVATGGQTHSTLVPAGDHLFAASKADDHIAIVTFDGTSLTAGPTLPTANGSGPRHMAMHPGGDLFYLVNELDRTLDTFTYQAGNVAPAQAPIALDLPTSPANGTAADVHVHPSGDYLYASLRRVGGNPGELVRVDLDAGLPTAATAVTTTQGETPRNFDITEDGRYVVVANQNSDNVVVFRVQDGSGELSESHTFTAPTKPFFVTVVDE